MKLVDVQVAAKKLSVSERTIYRMLNDPLCPLTGVRIYRAGVRVVYDSIATCMDPIAGKACQVSANSANPDKCDKPP